MNAQLQTKLSTRTHTDTHTSTHPPTHTVDEVLPLFPLAVVGGDSPLGLHCHSPHWWAPVCVCECVRARDASPHTLNHTRMINGHIHSITHSYTPYTHARTVPTNTHARKNTRAQHQEFMMCHRTIPRIRCRTFTFKCGGI